MSWLYSQALVAEFLAASCSDGALCAPSSGSPIPHAYLPSDKTKAFSRLSRYGMTFAPLTESLGADVLTWCLVDSLAKTSASPAKAQDSTERAAACGMRWPESLAKFDLASFSWRTPQLSLLADLGKCLETWPRSGLMLHGECWPLQTLEHRTDESESGLWPTPIANDAQKLGTKRYAQGGMPLTAAVLLWPTPTAQDAKNNGAPAQMVRNTLPLNAQVGGALNPTWVEWLMGWPLGWTDLKLSETDKCLSALQRHSENSPATLGEAA